MSIFEFEETPAQSARMRVVGVGGGGGNAVNRMIEESLSGVLQPGKRFYYDYGFGSTTKLTLKVLGFIEPVLDPDDIHLLARNDLPEIACRQCGNHLATTICLLCDYTGKNWLCEKHQDK